MQESTIRYPDFAMAASLFLFGIAIHHADVFDVVLVLHESITPSDDSLFFLVLLVELFPFFTDCSVLCELFHRD